MLPLLLLSLLLLPGRVLDVVSASALLICLKQLLLLVLSLCFCDKLLLLLLLSFCLCDKLLALCFCEKLLLLLPLLSFSSCEKFLLLLPLLSFCFCDTLLPLLLFRQKTKRVTLLLDLVIGHRDSLIESRRNCLVSEPGWSMRKNTSRGRRRRCRRETRHLCLS